MYDLSKKLIVSAAIRFFVKILRFESLPEFFRLCFFVSSSDALFSFYICSHSKAENVKFSE